MRQPAISPPATDRDRHASVNTTHLCLCHSLAQPSPVIPSVVKLWVCSGKASAHLHLASDECSRTRRFRTHVAAAQPSPAQRLVLPPEQTLRGVDASGCNISCFNSSGPGVRQPRVFASLASGFMVFVLRPRIGLIQMHRTCDPADRCSCCNQTWGSDLWSWQPQPFGGCRVRGAGQRTQRAPDRIAGGIWVP